MQTSSINAVESVNTALWNAILHTTTHL